MPGKARVSRRARRRRAAVASFGRSLFEGCRRAAPWLLLLVIIIGLPALAIVGWDKGLRSDFFNVVAVDVEGVSQTPVRAVQSAVGFTGTGINIFTLDPELGRRRVERLPWVKAAAVTRVLPDRMKVVVEERQAHGVIVRDGLWLVDVDGNVFAPVDRDPQLNAPIISLPGVGRSVPQTEAERIRIREAMLISRLYEKHGLDAWDRLAEVEIDPVAGYSLITEKRGLRVLLGEGRMEARLSRLEDVFQALERKEISDATLVRLDGDGALQHVAVSTQRPRTGQ